MNMFMRLKGGLQVFIKGLLFQDTKAVIATYLVGAPVFFIIGLLVSAVLGVFMESYASVGDDGVWLISIILTLPIIDVVFDKIGGIDKKIKIK